MKNIKLNNIIFPIWIVSFFPPTIFIILLGNFIIDSVVLIICFYVFKDEISTQVKSFYKNNIFEVWCFGFISDIVGAILLFATCFVGSKLNLPDKIISSIMSNPFNNLIGALIVIAVIGITMVLIYKLNVTFTFRKLTAETGTKIKIAAVIALITAPWTFLIPTELFY